MKRSRPAFLVVVHSIWMTVTAALLLASCTVVSNPTGYSYQPVPCPPNVMAPPQAQQPQAQPPIPVPNGQAQTEPQAPPPPPAAQQAAPQCYAAVPNNYTYDYYPGVYAYPYYGYPYYAAPYYGYWYGGVWFHGHGHWH